MPTDDLDADRQAFAAPAEGDGEGRRSCEVERKRLAVKRECRNLVGKSRDGRNWTEEQIVLPEVLRKIVPESLDFDLASDVLGERFVSSSQAPARGGVELLVPSGDHAFEVRTGLGPKESDGRGTRSPSISCPSTRRLG